MRKKLQNFMIKAFSLCLAFILVFPTNLFAMGLDNTKTKKYSATASIMGLAPNDESDEVNTDASLLETEVSTKETDQYLIEKSASLSKTTGQIDFRIKVNAKDKRAADKILASFAISQNTDLKDLKLEKVCQIHTDHSQEEIKYQEQRPSILYTNDSFETLGVTTENKDLVYYLSAKLTDEALAGIQDKSPIMDLTFSIGAYLQDNYSLSIEKLELMGEDGQVDKSIQTIKEEPVQQIKAIFKEKTSSLLGEKPAEIIWTDYIKADDDHSYDIELDQSQDTSESTIKVEFYQASEKGYVIKDEHTQTMDFAQSLTLQIPQDQIAKIEVSTKVKGNPKSFTYNNKEIPNPYYKEQTSQAEEKSDDKENTEKDEDPLPVDSAKEQTSTKSSDDIIADEKSTDTLKEESQSAIELNKEAYIQNVENKEPVNQIAKALAEYNNNEIDFDQVKASVESIAKDHNLGSSQTQEIIEALLIGLNEENHKAATINPADLTVDIKEAMEEEEPKITDAEIKDLIKEEFAKKDAGQITEEELEASLATIREENNIDKETFFNILEDLYQNGEIANDSQEDTTTIKTDKTKEEALAEKLAEENLSTEDFIRFLQSYIKSYDIKEDQLESLLKENQVEVEKVIGDFTIGEIVAAAYLEGLNPHIFAAGDPSVEDSDVAIEDFKTELEYYTETLTRATNEQKLFDIVRNSQPGLTDQAIRNDYVGWMINIPGTDNSHNDITEIKKKKYEYDNLNFSIYAPAGQSLEKYRVVVEDGEDGTTSYSGSMTGKKGEHYIYSFSIPKNKLTEKGYNIYVVAKAPKKRQNYAIGLKVSPDKNYVNTLVKEYENKFEEFKEKYPLLIKWMDTSAANPYRQGINLIDTRMVYLEPNGWQDLFPYNGFRSVDYNDNIDDTDIMKNRVSMFGNIDKNGQITWTISETFPAEKLVNKNTVGIDAYSAKTDGQGLTGPSVQILVPNDNGGYDVTDLGNVAKETLQEKIGNKPGTIVNYTFTDKATNKEEFTTLSLDSGKSASIAHKPVLERKPEDAVDTTGLEYLHKVQTHNDGPGYEIALSNDQAHTMKAFIPKKPSANPRYNDPDFTRTGVIVFCLNPGKPEPTRQYKFNGTITKGEWSTAKSDWVKNGKAIASLATANEAKASPLYKGSSDDAFYASLYEYLLRMYWYGQEIAEEYQLSEQSYYKIIQYNLYYWLAGENYAESFRNGGGYNPNYFSSAEYSYATGLKNRIEQGKDWGKVKYDEEIQFFYYGHDKTRSYQNTITGDTKRKAKKGSVTVNKVDKDGNKLPGAYFQLLDANQQPIKTLVTDANGVAVFDDLDYGTYYIKEVQGPKGYQFTEEISDAIVVGEKQAHHTFNYKNKKNEIDFRKVNENGRTMEGVVFELRQNGRVLSDQDQTSGKDGKFSWKELTPGNYQVVEKDISKYPDYSENEGRTVASFRVDENNKIQDKKIYYPNRSSQTDIVNKKNEGKPIGIEFTKVDLKTENPLEGAEFVLEYRKPNSSIFRELPGSRRKSNSEGKLIWNDLVDGDYRVIETKAPEGNYDTDLNLGEKATFTIAKNQNGYYEITNVEPENRKITNNEKPEEPKKYFGEFEFTKVDSETKDKLQGVEFTLTSNDPVGPEKDKFDYKFSKTTDAEGKIKYSKLYPGTYTLKETKQLPGYKENTKTWKVVVDEQGNTKVQAEGGSYNIEITGNDTNFRFASVATIKETLEKTDQPDVLKYTIAIKPKEPLDSIKFSGDSNNFSGIGFGDYIRLNSAPAGKEIVKSYNIKIKNIDSLPKNEEISPIYGILISAVSRNERSLGSNPKFKIVDSSNSSTLTITNDKEKPEPANLTIKKVDSETNEGLEGAKFELYRTKENAMSRTGIVDYATTNEHGYALFDSPEIMPNTTYYVKEIAAPDGYKITSEITKVTSSGSADNTINAEIPNEKNNARFELYKKDTEGNYLEGAKFRLLDGNQKPFEPDRVETTDSNGYIKFDNLEAGKIYYLEEAEAPEGYNKKDDQLKLTVGEDGNISWGENSLVEEKYTGPNVTEIEELGHTWTSTEDHKWESDPSYLNTREYAELVNPKTGEINYYVMLKAFDYQGNGTNTNTKLQLSTKNATIKKVELYEADFYNSEVKSRVAKAMKDGTIANNTDLRLANAPNTTAGNITMSVNTQKPLVTNTLSFNNATDQVNINFPYNKQKNAGRFDTNWAYVAKVTAEVIDKKQAARVQYHWNNSSDASIYIENYQEVPAIDDPSKTTIVTPPTFSVINEKKPFINFVKEDVASGEKLYGAEFVLYKDSKEVKNSLTSSDKEGKFGFDNLEDGSYTVYETASPEGYPYLEEKLEVASFTVNGGKITIIKTNPDFGETQTSEVDTRKTYVIYNKVNEVKFKKVNKDGQALEGATFKLDKVWDSYDDSGKLQSHRETVLDNIETLDDGLISLSATTPGRYQLVETSAPEGYKHISTTNKAGGLIVAEFTVKERTLAIKNISIGDKYFQNMEDINDNDSLKIVNKKKVNGKFQVNKVEKDGDSIKPLIGARFLLKDLESGQYVKIDGTFTTNSGSALTDATLSKVNYQNLPVGEYELREFKSPDGYIRTINTWKIEVNDDGKTTISENPKLDNDVEATITEETSTTPANLQLENKSNEIEFTKIDSKTGDALEGVEFEIWWDQQANRTSDNKLYKNYVKIKNSNGSTTFTTGADGKIKLTNLKTGHYKIYEVKIPDGYKVEDKPVDNEPIADEKGEFVNEFFVDMDGDIKKNDNGIVGGKDDVLVTTIKNTPITGKFRVQKVGEDGVEKLEDAEFELYKVDENGNAQGESIIPKPIDGVKGLVEFADLEYGQYLLEETKAPTGYVLSTTKWEVNVSIDGKVNISSTDESSSFTRTDDTLTLNVVNKKPTYPSTGGTGVKIAFALIGTAVMITALAYFGILNTSKTRRR